MVALNVGCVCEEGSWWGRDRRGWLWGWAVDHQGVGERDVLICLLAL